MSKKKIQGYCVYCEVFGEIENEHVVAKCLVPEPRPNEMITVPSCNKCNHDIKSKCDTYLRDLLEVIIDTSRPDDRLQEKTFRSFDRNSSKLKIDMDRTIGFSEVTTPAGIIYNHPCFTADPNMYCRTLTFIVKGLYYNSLGKILSKDCKFIIERVVEKEILEDRRKIKEATHRGKYLIKEGDTISFWADVIISPDNHNISQWWLYFHGMVCFYVATFQNDDEAIVFKHSSNIPNRFSYVLQGEFWKEGNYELSAI